MNELIYIIIGVALVNNIVLSKITGPFPFFGKFKQMGDEFGVGLATSMIMVISAAIIWVMGRFVLVPLNFEYMSLVIYVSLVAVTAQLVYFLINKINHPVNDGSGIFLALIIADCSVFGTILTGEVEGHSLIDILLTALGTGTGFTLVLVIISGIMKSIELSDCPGVLKGLPIAFITATCLGLVFYGFSGLNLG